jgi:hypothetical protein
MAAKARRRGALGKTEVFGIVERGGKLSVEVVPSDRASHAPPAFGGQGEQSRLVSTGPFQASEGLVARRLPRVSRQENPLHKRPDHF